MTEDYALARLKEIYLQRAVQIGAFTLASGAKSPYYVDSRQVTMDAEGLDLLGHLLYEASATSLPSAVGGPAVGAVPLVAATLLTYRRRGWQPPPGGFYVRAPKDHGTRRAVEGFAVGRGHSVVLLEDVVTTGTSVLETIGVVEAAGATVALVLACVDRLQGARKTLQGYAFRSLLTVEDLGIKPDPAPEPVAA